MKHIVSPNYVFVENEAYLPSSVLETLAIGAVIVVLVLAIIIVVKTVNKY